MLRAPPVYGANAETLRNWLSIKELIVSALVSNVVSVLEQTVKGGKQVCRATHRQRVCCTKWH
jgi:hypothetical protein